MSKKKKVKKNLDILIPALLIVIAGLIGGYILFHKPYTENFRIGKATIEIKAHAIDDEKKPVDSMYTTSFAIGFSTKTVFYVDFLNVTDKSEKITVTNEERVKKDVYVSDLFEKDLLAIGDKDYAYVFDSSGTCGRDVLLFHELSETAVLKVRVRGGEMYSHGSQLKCLAAVTKKALHNRELKEIMSFKINGYE